MSPYVRLFVSWLVSQLVSQSVGRSVSRAVSWSVCFTSHDPIRALFMVRICSFVYLQEKCYREKIYVDKIVLPASFFCF